MQKSIQTKDFYKMTIFNQTEAAISFSLHPYIKTVSQPRLAYSIWGFYIRNNFWHTFFLSCIFSRREMNL